MRFRQRAARIALLLMLLVSLPPVLPLLQLPAIERNERLVHAALALLVTSNLKVLAALQHDVAVSQQRVTQTRRQAVHKGWRVKTLRGIKVNTQ